MIYVDNRTVFFVRNLFRYLMRFCKVVRRYMKRDRRSDRPLIPFVSRDPVKLMLNYHSFCPLVNRTCCEPNHA